MRFLSDAGGGLLEYRLYDERTFDYKGLSRVTQWSPNRATSLSRVCHRRATSACRQVRRGVGLDLSESGVDLVPCGLSLVRALDRPDL